MNRPREIQSLVVMSRRLDRPVGGAALRNLQNIRGLAKLGPVDVISVGPADPPGPVAGVRHYEHVAREGPKPAIQRLWGKRWVFLPSAHPFVTEGYQDSAREAIRRRFESISYDVAVVEELGLAGYLGDLKHGCCLTIFDAHNLESSLSGQMAESRNGHSGILGKWKRDLMVRQLVAAERQVARSSERVWACSEVDQEGFIRLTGGSPRVDVIPNSIDVPSYSQPDRCHEADDWTGEPMLLTYLGAYSYYPNEQAALELINEVLPLLTARGIRAKVQLVGAHPTSSMRDAANGRDDVEITGPVDSVFPYLRQRCLMVLPIRLGGGTRLKILESFAANRPVISTAKGVEGIDAVDGRHLLVRESPADIADAAVLLWQDRELRAGLCRNAHQLVTDLYSFESTGERIRDSVLDMMDSVRS